jgi:carboxymethylenebutenolidase
MCFDEASAPPLPPRTGQLAAVTLENLEASDGACVAAATARTEAEDAPGLVLVPDRGGLHRYYMNVAPLAAAAGIHCVAIDPYGRTAGAGYRSDDFDATDHRKAARDATVTLDVGAALTRLRDLGAARLYVMGFCFGGRVALMQATRSDVDGVIGLYPWPAAAEEGGSSPILEAEAGRVRAPVLAIYGGADDKIPPEHQERFASALARHGVPHESVAYPGLPHGFFDRRKVDAAEACQDVWCRVFSFTGVIDG